MAFKQKLKSFLFEITESTRSADEETSSSEIVVSPAVAKFKEHLLSQLPNDPQADREAIDSIDQVYFKDGDFDTREFELKKLSDTLSLSGIDGDRKKLLRQLQAVSRKVSDSILDNHPAFAAELQKVMELQLQLQKAGLVCINGRSQLSQAKNGFTTASLGLLANFRKRQQLVALLKSLRTIKTLQRTDIRLREMLEEEDYPGAIQLCLECQKAAANYRHYHCISELSSKLQDTLEMIEESLDVALSKTCNDFDETHYEKVQTAYRLLGKTQTAMDQLHMHFTSAIHNTAFTKVLGYVELCAGTGESNFQKRQYTDLCKHITHEVFTPCLVDLCKALWEVMKSYYKTMQWHETHEQDISAEGENGGTMEASLNRRYIRQKLEHGLTRIWGDVQQKVKTYVLSTDLSYFKYDEFIQVLGILNRLIHIGEEFCGSKSEGLQDSIRKQSVNYFRNYHRSRMDELRMFLENEGWELCPVKSSFSILMLQEFRFMRQKADQSDSPQLSPVSPESNDKSYGCYFEKYSAHGSPFDIQTEEEDKEDVWESGYAEDGAPQRTFATETDSDEDIPAELKQDYVDEHTGDTPAKRITPISSRRRRSDRLSGKKAPIVTNTTLNVCRLFGKYMQMMTVLKPIAFDVIICLSQLFDYYLFAVYSFFGTDVEMEEMKEAILSNKLRTTLKRIRDNLILQEEQLQQVQQGAAPATLEYKVAYPHISPIVDLTSPEKFHGLAERVVATESLVFLSNQFEFLQPHLESMIPSSKKAFLQQFYSQTISTAQELRKPVYRTVAARSVDYDQLLQLMNTTVKWDIKDIMSQHSNYVDVLLQQYHIFSERLSEVKKVVPIPSVVTDVLWEHCIKLANRTFVEGYACAKKCTNEGRALMQLDFKQFLLKLEKLTDLRPIPDRDFVEVYIKAYYLPEAQLEVWIPDHKEYSPKQLISLVNCMAHLNRKSRQKLINMIEDLDRIRRQ